MGVRDALRRLERSGLTGPAYRGLAGKARYVFESLVYRRELIFVISEPRFREVPAPTGPELVLERVTEPNGYLRHEKSIDGNWYPGFTRKWVAAFGWGEEVVLATLHSEVVGFSWLQQGNAQGFPHFYGRLLEREWRILRQAVAPAHRGKGIQGSMTHRILGQLFDADAERVFIECYENNIPSRKAFARTGFTQLGTVRVLEIPLLRGFIRWSSR